MDLANQRRVGAQTLPVLLVPWLVYRLRRAASGAFGNRNPKSASMITWRIRFARSLVPIETRTHQNSAFTCDGEAALDTVTKDGSSCGDAAFSTVARIFLAPST